MIETERVTAGPWVIDERPEYTLNVYSSDQTGSIVAECGPFKYVPRQTGINAANAKFIVSAVNACFELADNDPERAPLVAAEIVEAFKRLHEIRDAFKAAALEVTSWNVGGDPECPPHPWHEEWFSHVDRLLERIQSQSTGGGG